MIRCSRCSESPNRNYERLQRYKVLIPQSLKELSLRTATYGLTHMIPSLCPHLPKPLNDATYWKLQQVFDASIFNHHQSPLKPDTKISTSISGVATKYAENLTISRKRRTDKNFYTRVAAFPGPSRISSLNPPIITCTVRALISHPDSR